MASAARRAKRQRQREARNRRRSVVGGNRVFLRRPSPPIRLPKDTDPEPAIEAFLDKVDRERAKEIYPVVRLTDAGVDWGAMPQEGDEIGYGMHPYRSDDCLRAAIATATQIPIEEVPDLRLDDRVDSGEDLAEISMTSWKQLEEWTKARGLAMEVWTELPPPRARWIGVASSYGADDEQPFNDHCLVLCHDRVVFDPTCSVAAPPGTKLSGCAPLTYGLSFDEEDE